MTNKIVYQSPSLAGFDFGVSFEPNYQSGIGQCANITTATCLSAASTDYTATAPSIALSNSAVAAQANNGFSAALQRKDAVEAVGRYMGAFGPAKVRLELGTMQAGVVGTTGLASTAATAKPVSLLVAGASVTVGNLLLGGNLQAGSMNTSTAPIVHGQKNTTDFILEAQYIIGNVTLGVSYMNALSAGTAYENAQGAVVNGSHMLHEVGYNLGGTWDFAQGASAYLSMIYGDRHQAGVNLLARGAAEGIGGQSGWNTGANTLHNNTSARAIAVGTVFNF
jgi:predicted porin